METTNSQSQDQQQATSETGNPTPLTLKPQNEPDELAVWLKEEKDREERKVTCLKRRRGYYEPSIKRCPCRWCIAESEKEAWEIEEQRQHPQEALWAFGVPTKHLYSSFETFVGGDEVKQFLIEASKLNTDILLCGKTGCGKTHLAVSTVRRRVEVSRQLMNPNRPPILFVPVPELLFEIRQSYSDKEVSEQEIVDRYSSVPLLILDDLGAEKTTEWAESILYLIIDRRNRYEKWTIVTSNLTLDEIERSLGARIASRLSDMKVINIKLPDYRKKRA
jgi:DNA replication protein DnaC